MLALSRYGAADAFPSMETAQVRHATQRGAQCATLKVVDQRFL